MSPSHASLPTSWIHIQNCLKGHFLVRCPVTPWAQIELNLSSFPNQFLLLHPGECFPPPRPGPSHQGQSGFTFLSSPLPSVTETCGFPPSHLSSPPTAHHACGGFCRPGLPALSPHGNCLRGGLPPCLSSCESSVFSRYHHSHLRKCPHVHVTFLFTNSSGVAPLLTSEFIICFRIRLRQPSLT